MHKEFISVFLPTFNEEENITKAIHGIILYLKKHFKQFELIVVDDGSKDNTAILVKKLQKKYPELRLVQHPSNRGYGAALQSGFAASKGTLIFYTDADNQFAIEDLEKVLPMIKKYDIISGYRLQRQDPLMRIITSEVYNMIIKSLFHLPIRDIDASFKLYKKAVFKHMRLKSQTGLIDAEVLIKSLKRGYTIGQVGVRHFPRIGGKTIYEMGNRNAIIAFVKPKVVINIFKEIQLLWNELR